MMGLRNDWQEGVLNCSERLWSLPTSGRREIVMKPRNLTRVCCGMLVVALVSAGIAAMAPMNGTARVLLSDHQMSAVSGGATDWRCWDFCPSAEGGGGCDVGASCAIYPDCSGGEFESQVEGTVCVVSNNQQHVCNAGTPEEVVCSSGYICYCTTTCTKYEYGELTVYKDC